MTQEINRIWQAEIKVQEKKQPIRDVKHITRRRSLTVIPVYFAFRL